MNVFEGADNAVGPTTRGRLKTALRSVPATYKNPLAFFILLFLNPTLTPSLSNHNMDAQTAIKATTAQPKAATEMSELYTLSIVIRF